MATTTQIRQGSVIQDSATGQHPDLEIALNELADHYNYDDPYDEFENSGSPDFLSRLVTNPFVSRDVLISPSSMQELYERFSKQPANYSKPEKSTPDQQIAELEQKLERLTREFNEYRNEMNRVLSTSIANIITPFLTTIRAELEHLSRTTIRTTQTNSEEPSDGRKMDV